MQAKIYLIYVFTIIAANVLLLGLANAESLKFHQEASSTILQKFDNVMGAHDEQENTVGRSIVPEHFLNP